MEAIQPLTEQVAFRLSKRDCKTLDEIKRKNKLRTRAEALRLILDMTRRTKVIFLDFDVEDGPPMPDRRVAEELLGAAKGRSLEEPKVAWDILKKNLLMQDKPWREWIDGETVYRDDDTVVHSVSRRGELVISVIVVLPNSRKVDTVGVPIMVRPLVPMAQSLLAQAKKAVKEQGT